jgi:hypothetical protein
LGSRAWALGLFVSQFLGPHAHPLVWYFFSLVLLVSLVVISLVVISLVVSCLRTVARAHHRSVVGRARARREQRAWRARGRGSAEVVGEAVAGPRRGESAARREAEAEERRWSHACAATHARVCDARREQRARRARREQRARMQGGRVGARARQRRGRSRQEFPVRTLFGRCLAQKFCATGEKSRFGKISVTTLV